MMAAPAVSTPFAVINSDDFYGREGYAVLSDYLRSVEGQKGKYSMVGYNLRNTLSDYGTVSRGECSVDADGNLASIVERTAIQRMEDGSIMYKDGDGLHPLDENTVVSMNLFGFTPDFFTESERLFRQFLSDPANMANPKAEFFIPSGSVSPTRKTALMSSAASVSSSTPASIPSTSGNNPLHRTIKKP